MAHHSQPPGIKARFTPSASAGSRTKRLLAIAGEVPGTPPAEAGATLLPSFEWARSGAMCLTGAAEEPPRLARGALATAARQTGEAIAALSGLPIHRDRDWPALLGERAALFGLARGGRTSCGGQARLLRSQDGWLAVQLPREDDWRAVPAWLELEPGAIDEHTRTAGPQQEDRRWSVLVPHVRTRAAEALVARGRLLGLAIAPASRDVPDDVRPGRLHDATVTAPRGVATARSGSPATALRVLDLSTLWAGPLATSLLAECGADVLKVESPERPDGARAGERRFFDLMNAGKDGAALDLTAPGDRARFEALLDAADVVVESARPRALAQLGYDATGWATAQPGRLWISITGYGREHEWIAFGDDAAVAAGLAWTDPSREDDGGGPVFCGDAIADPLTGLHAGALALAYLHAGHGGLLDLALRDVAADCARERDPDAGTIEIVRFREDAVAEACPAWQLRLGDRATGVAAPRARPPSGAAPPLRPLRAETLRRWTGRTC